MGGPGAQLGVEAGVQAVMEKVDSLDQKSNGKFLKTYVPGLDKSETISYDGSEIPW
jgi:hypothetical protein